MPTTPMGGACGKVTGTTMDVPHRFDDIRHRRTTASTNADVLALARDGAGEGVVVVAETQTAGRGRHGRTWVAPEGAGLLMSVLLRPTADRVGLITPVAGLAVLEAARGLGAHGLGLKWPNDVIAVEPPEPLGPAPDRKLAGILAESEWVGSAADGPRVVASRTRIAVALGIGLNLRAVGDVPPEIATRRITLDELVAELPDDTTVLHGVLRSLEAWYGRLVRDPESVVEVWRRECVTLRRRVRVDLGARDLTGTAVDLDAEGHLVITDDEGTDHVVAAGDVVHLRDAR